MAAKNLRNDQNQISRRRAFRQFAVQLHADDLRRDHVNRLAEHASLCLDPADAPTYDAEPVDHRRVRIGADQRIREREVIAHLHHFREVLKIHLMHDANGRRHNIEILECLCPHFKNSPLAIALKSSPPL